MKCSKHSADAVAICSHCGRALCPECFPAVMKPIACSEECATALSRRDRIMDLLVKKSLQSNRATAFYCFLCGALSVGGGFGARSVLPEPFLIWFLFGCGATFIACGAWYLSISRKTKL